MKIKTLLTILFAFLFLGGVKAQMQPGTFVTLYSAGQTGSTYYDGANYYLIDNTPGRAPIHVYDSETGNVLTSDDNEWDFDDDREVALDVFGPCSKSETGFLSMGYTVIITTV